MTTLDKLIENWGCRKSVSTPGFMLVPSDLLEQLVLLAFGRAAFSEEEYFERYPDVQKSVQNKQFVTGLQHFIWEGIRECRNISDTQVDPARYLSLNPDLGSVPELQSPESIMRHWLSVGWLEGRYKE